MPCSHLPCQYGDGACECLTYFSFVQLNDCGAHGHARTLIPRLLFHLHDRGNARESSSHDADVFRACVLHYDHEVYACCDHGYDYDRVFYAR